MCPTTATSIYSNTSAFTFVVCMLISVVFNIATAYPLQSIREKQKDQTQISNGNLFEGDILLVEGDKRYRYQTRRSDILHQRETRMDMEYTHIWPNKTIYYVFGQTLSERYRAKFQQAMSVWSENTCIQFAPATSGEQDHIVFVESDDLGCSSYVGRKGGAQLVSLSDYCYYSTGHAIHQIGHAIGLWHEHSRPDRDTYIDVLYDNIIETETDNFGKLLQEKFDLVPDVGYDIESVMHYGPFSFSKEGSGTRKVTIRLRDDAPLNYKSCANLLSLGQRDQLSYLDKLRANQLYSCQAEITALKSEGRYCVTPTIALNPTTPSQVTTVLEVTTTQPKFNVSMDISSSFQPKGVSEFSVSVDFITGISIVGIMIMATVCFLNVVAGACIKSKRYSTSKTFRLTRITKTNKDQQLRVVCYLSENNCYEREDPDFTDNRWHVVVRGSFKKELSPYLNIKSANLKVLDPIGQGEFGIVYKGYLAGQYGDEVVAIKTLKGFVDKLAVQELLSECIKMKNLNHPHVMTLKGVCLDGGPVPYLVLPYMANGSLLSYLKKERSNFTISTAEDENLSLGLIIKKQLLGMCLQVAKGMEYLASEKMVHRDLAARNCMVDMNMVIKVADFGLSVNMGTKEYYRLTGDVGVKLAIMWMAPESLSDYMFSEKSDVWSYGVTCWEIFTGGLIPYVGTRPLSLLTLLQQGGRLEIPNNPACSKEIYSIMLSCWEMEPGKRPSFSALVKTLSKSLENMAGYLPVGSFADLNEDCAHYVHGGAITETDRDVSTGQEDHNIIV